MKVAPNTNSSFRPLFSTDHSQNETEALCSGLLGSASVFLSSLQLLISNLEFLIVTLELEFPLTPTKQTLHPFSNRYKARFLRPPWRKQGSHPPWRTDVSNPRWTCRPAKFLIANPRLEFPVSLIRISQLEFSNRDKMRVLHPPWRTRGFRPPWRTVISRPASRSCSSGLSSFQPRASSFQNPCADLAPQGFATYRLGNCSRRLFIFGMSQIWM